MPELVKEKPGFIGSDAAVARGTCTQWENFPDCEIVMRSLSANERQETVVRRPFATPELVLDCAGKGAG